MDTIAKQILEGILAKSLQDLTELDIAILNARVDYLNADQKERFAPVLKKNNTPTAPVTQTEPEVEVVDLQTDPEPVVVVPEAEPVNPEVAQVAPEDHSADPDYQPQPEAAVEA